MGTSSELSASDKAHCLCPDESCYLSPGRTHLIKHTLDQISQQSANCVDQHCPEKVQHRHHLPSEDMPTSANLHRAQDEGKSPTRLACPFLLSYLEKTRGVFHG
nr:MAG TPA: hypothetical protein [Caudoviricetes sp.]